ncbi:MAG: LysR family transcriptional regulator [Hyphomicrobiales bacterium]
MELRWFEDVLVLLEEQNLTRAAARRNVTQPAFSRRIRSFENWLGTPLLERGANKIEFNSALLANEHEIKSLIKQMYELRTRINNFQPENTAVTLATQHSLIFSAFPDIAALTNAEMPRIHFRLRAGNRSECVSMFLREEASILLCYEGTNEPAMPFDETITRNEWGDDRLVLVAGGKLRYIQASDGKTPLGTPSICYPEQSHFGELLSNENLPYSTRSHSINPVCETAFSAGIKEMVIKGLGIAWLPMSMVYQELDRGTLTRFGQLDESLALKITYYTKILNPISNDLRLIWARTSKPQIG